jgi:hypothetical protein
MKRTFEIIDRPTRDGFHRYTVRIDNGQPWLENASVATMGDRLKLFQELLAWLQADAGGEVRIDESTNSTKLNRMAVAAVSVLNARGCPGP